eukprot:32104-Prorocentrum_minimum.AAC.5
MNPPRQGKSGAAQSDGSADGSDEEEAEEEEEEEEEARGGGGEGEGEADIPGTPGTSKGCGTRSGPHSATRVLVFVSFKQEAKQELTGRRCLPMSLKQRSLMN